MPAESEILVVDDASPQAAASKVAAEFPAVRTVRLPMRRGFCAAANVGIQAVTGSVVELLNDDTEVLDGWADAALEHFADPAVVAVAPLVLRWPGGQEPVIDSAGDRYYLGGVAGKRGHGEPLGPAYVDPRHVFGASGSSAFYRRATLLHVGAFPESFGAYFEDVDLSFRLNQAGGRIHFEPRSRVLHHVSASYGRLHRRLLEQQSQNEERVFWRNVPTTALPTALPHHLAVLAAKAWRRWQEGTLTPFLLGRMRILGELPALLRHRRRLRSAPGGLCAWGVETRYWN